MNEKRGNDMKLDVTSVFGLAADLLPGGSLLKSIVRGAGSILLKRAAKTAGLEEKQIDSLLSQALKLADEDDELKRALRQEEEERRQFELAFFGRMADLEPRAQLLRAITRPILSLGLLGLFTLGILIQYGQQLIVGIPGADCLAIPGALVELTKWVVAFWFTSKGVEKIAGLIK